MKQLNHFSKGLMLTIISFCILINLSISKNMRSSKGTCSISTISMPVGSSSPVMIYNARLENDSWKLTVLDKDQSSKYKVTGSLFFTDKDSGESWYTDKSVDEKDMETMRDAFSLCRTLNADNKETKDFQNSHAYDQHRTSELPANVALRTANANANVRTSSFLQMKMKMQMRSRMRMRMAEEGEDMDLDKELDELDREEVSDPEVESYKNLNNEAYITNKQLQDELRHQNDNYNSNSINNDLFMD